jgi:hypothetical protein
VVKENKSILFYYILYTLLCTGVYTQVESAILEQCTHRAAPPQPGLNHVDIYVEPISPHTERGERLRRGGGIQCPHLLTHQHMKKQRKRIRGNKMAGMEEKWNGIGL